jgi:hypothetical protein
MKSVRQGIDAMGREINSITGSLARYKKGMEGTGGIRTLHTTIMDLKTDFLKSADKDRRISERISGITKRLEAIADEEQALCHDERQSDVAEMRNELTRITQARDAIARSYSAHSMTASHVFRKAEKIATRQHHLTEIAKINHAMDLLSGHDVPDTDQLTEVLSAACPIAEKMIDSGDIILKNKEERAIFSDIPQFCAMIQGSCRELIVREEEHRKAEEALASHPLLVKINALGREKVQLESMLEKERRALQDIEDWRAKTQNKIPALTEELRKKMEDREENVQIQIGNCIPS